MEFLSSLRGTPLAFLVVGWSYRWSCGSWSIDGWTSERDVQLYLSYGNPILFGIRIPNFWLLFHESHWSLERDQFGWVATVYWDAYQCDGDRGWFQSLSLALSVAQGVVGLLVQRMDKTDRKFLQSLSVHVNRRGLEGAVMTHFHDRQHRGHAIAERVFEMPSQHIRERAVVRTYRTHRRGW